MPWLVERNGLSELENQIVAKYTSDLKVVIQDRNGLQNIWILQEAINITMKAETIESDKKVIFYKRASPPAEPLFVRFFRQGKALQHSPTNPNMSNVDNSGRFGHRYQTRGVPQHINSYARPTWDICYRWHKPRHRSNASLKETRSIW